MLHGGRHYMIWILLIWETVPFIVILCFENEMDQCGITCFLFTFCLVSLSRLLNQLISSWVPRQCSPSVITDLVVLNILEYSYISMLPFTPTLLWCNFGSTMLESWPLFSNNSLFNPDICPCISICLIEPFWVHSSSWGRVLLRLN